MEGHINKCVVVLGLTLLQAHQVLSRDTCMVYGAVYTYCEDGYYCCYNNTRCCTSGLSIGAIVGIIVGIILTISLCAFCAALFLKKKNKPGRVIHPPNQQVFAVSTVTPNQYPGGSSNPYASQYPAGSTNPYAQPYGSYGFYGNYYKPDAASAPPLHPVQPPPYTDVRDISQPPAYTGPN